MSQALEIANTILSQIRAGRGADNKPGVQLMMCWGFRQPVALPEMTIADDFYLGGVQFRVSGFKHKGLVRVLLRGDDTYTVQIGFNRKGFRVKEELEMIYCDQLTEIVDGLVES